MTGKAKLSQGSCLNVSERWHFFFTVLSVVSTHFLGFFLGFKGFDFSKNDLQLDTLPSQSNLVQTIVILCVFNLLLKNVNIIFYSFSNIVNWKHIFYIFPQRILINLLFWCLSSGLFDFWLTYNRWKSSEHVAEERQHLGKWNCKEQDKT